MLSFSRAFQAGCLAGCAVLFSSLCFAQTPLSGSSPRFAGQPFSATADELRAAAAAVPVDSEYAAQMLLDEGTYRYAADGTQWYQHRLIYRLDSEEGVKNWAEASIEWDPWYQKPAQIKARVLRADGHFVDLDPKTITDAPVKGEDSETYSESRIRRAPLPGLAVGAIVEEVETVDEKTPFFSAGVVHQFVLNSTVPVVEARVIVELPSSTPYKDHVVMAPSVVVSRGEAEGRRRIVYEQMHVPASQDSDINLSTNEADEPSIQFATGASWQDIARSYAALADPHIVSGDTVSILPAISSTDRNAVIAAVVAKLHQEVRYTGVEFGEAALVPQRPAEVLKRHYGDCKDKAAMLVAMLRAKNIPANLALLDTGPGADVDPSLPGMGMFDHAIVYVPASGSDGAMWIDATAEFYKPGSLPYMDQGRSALIVAGETTGLTHIPDSRPEDSQLLETRNFVLPQEGSARVVETSETRGIRDADYREDYGGTDTSAVRKKMEEYVQSEYVAKTLVSVTHGKANDLASPFLLTVTMGKAQRGATGIDEAAVYVFPSFVLDQLPRWFKTKGETLNADTPPAIKHQLELEQANRAASYVFQPFIDERTVRVAIPAGFSLRSLPPKKTTQLGPATLTETYSSSEPGFVNAVFRFNTGSGHVTAEEALALRAAALELQNRQYVGLYFDQVGAKAIAQGHIREALEADRAVIAERPKEALPHVRLSRALLQAGVGDEAHTEARRATELEPKLPIAWSSLGWTLEHDTLGVRFGMNYDLEGAIRAFKQAITLDPENDDKRFDLAILYEFNSRGTRYAKDAHMADAVATYRDLVERNKEKNPDSLSQYRENLLVALVMTGQFGEADKLLALLPASINHAAIAVVSATVQHGVAAGIAQADQANLGASSRSQILVAAGSTLAQLRRYDEAAQILQAGISGGDNAPTVARQVELYKGLQPASMAPLPLKDPARPVQQIMFAGLLGTLTREDVLADLAHHAYTSPASLEFAVAKNLRVQGVLRRVAETSKSSETVLADLLAGNMKFTSSGGDATGYPVIMTSIGTSPSQFFVVREDGAYRIVADQTDSVEVGNEALYLLEHDNAPSAKALLDWKRDLTHKSGQDDAFAGPLLPRFWTVGSSKPDAESPAAMRLAAISLLAGSMDAKPYLAEIAADREKASGSRQTDLDLLLASLADGAEEGAIALPAALRLLDQEPDSTTALQLAGRAYAFQGDSKGWLAMLGPRLAKKPKDHDLLLEQARADQAAHNWSDARSTLQTLTSSEKVTAADYNAYAWLGLMDGHLGEAEIKAAQQSNMLSKNANFGDLHTLACVYAAEGKITEARQTLTTTIYASGQLTPNSAVWYALGLIYEQYGETEAALNAYRKVEAHELDNHAYIDPASTYLLAQNRIKALGGAK